MREFGDLFDPQFMYFKWDLKLEDECGYVIDCYADLDSMICNGEKPRHVFKSSNRSYPFSADGFNANYALCYCDPYIEYKLAFLNGQDVWYDCTLINDDNYTEYFNGHYYLSKFKTSRDYYIKVDVRLIRTVKISAPSLDAAIAKVKEKFEADDESVMPTMGNDMTDVEFWEA